MPADSVCQCCGKVKPLQLDHEHENQTFRGWLCRACNTGIGSLQDCLEGVKLAIAYLENVTRTDIRGPGSNDSEAATCCSTPPGTPSVDEASEGLCSETGGTADLQTWTSIEGEGLDDVQREFPSGGHYRHEDPEVGPILRYLDSCKSLESQSSFGTAKDEDSTGSHGSLQKDVDPTTQT